MHDIDRTQVGFAPQAESYVFPYGGDGGALGEDEQMNLAAELMGVTNEQELDNFLGDLFKKVSGAVGKVIHSPVGSALGGILKDAAKKILPSAGQALGNLVGAGQIGQQLGQTIGGMFEAESEEQEWNAANTFVKLSTDAVKNAAQAPPGANPQAVAKNAVIEAAKVHAPSLVPILAGNGAAAGTKPSETNGKGRTGRWIRRGKHIVLMGV
jgi:hypothetical protein